jgi:hypothetical protein
MFCLKNEVFESKICKYEIFVSLCKEMVMGLDKKDEAIICVLRRSAKLFNSAVARRVV